MLQAQAELPTGRAFLSLLAFSGLFCDDQLTSKASLLARVGILFSACSNSSSKRSSSRYKSNTAAPKNRPMWSETPSR